MKRLLLLILLISLGLNLGLAWRFYDDRRQRPDHHELVDVRGDKETGRFGSRWQRPVPSDSLGWDEMARRRLDRISESLELRPEQATALGKMHRDATKLVRNQRRRIELAKVRLHDLVGSGHAEPESLGLAVRALANQRAALDSLVTEMMLDELELLDDDQRRRYLEMLPLERGPHRFGRGGRSGSGRGFQRPAGR